MLSITENLFLGNEISRHGVIDWHQAHARANDLLARVGLDTRPQTLVGNLGIGQQQLVEIAKALAKDVRLLIWTSRLPASMKRTAIGCSS